MQLFDELMREIDDGIAGRNAGLPMGFDRLNRHISIRKSTNFLIGGYTGSGKTSILDDAFILNPVEYFLRNYHTTSIRFKILYWSMERRKNFKIAKWISRKIFLDTGIIIPINRMMGWCPASERLTLDERNLIEQYRDYVEAILEVVEFRDAENPTGIRNFMRGYWEANGKIEQIDEFKKVYIPNNPHLITLKIKDHLGLIRKEKGLYTKKEVIDKASEDDMYDRDFYGCTCVNLSQFNRDIANPMRIKNGDVEPMMEDFKDSGNTQEDADVVISLFDPMRYKVPDPSNYDLTRLRDSKGSKKYRALRILKNSYGADDIRIGLAFQPEIGMFKEMPKLADTTAQTYEDIQDNSYFLPERR